MNIPMLDVVTLGETMGLFTPNKQGYLRYTNQFSQSFAGSETNVAIGVSRMGYKAGWISRVGKDEFGKGLLMFLRGEDIDLTFVKEDNVSPTGLMFKEYLRENQTRVFYYRSNSAASRLSPKDIDVSYIRQAKYLFVSGITPALSKSCHQAVMAAIKIAKEHGVQVVFDPNLRKTLWEEDVARQTLLDIAKQADIVLPGISEGEFLFGTNDVKEIGDKLLELGAKTVVIKLGKAGASVITGNGVEHVPGYKVQRVVDPIGAGDAFAAGFITGLLDKLPLYESVQRANAFGALATQVKGDIEGLPEREQLSQFMNSTSDDVER
ncbi:sugar kinase [Neobacillus sp. CF12]|uniref:sugar kinase n=1 Tax=Neobacillus sp. CF12 TaxID=3055864 RepID=UPI0025A01EF0|nr:sugar kinase [Neobacillus sp. CF12]MDM5331308.1 sugar kinase [Neobacillus sp. CF12]